MLKLVFLALSLFVFWNIGRFIFLVIRVIKSADPSGKVSGNSGNIQEKDITGKARIIEEDSRDSR